MDGVEREGEEVGEGRGGREWMERGGDEGGEEGVRSG